MRQVLIAFDVGNSAVKCAAGGAGRWDLLFTIPTLPVDSLGERLAAALDDARLPDGPPRWVASSVCPEADEALAADCRRRGVPGPEMFGRELPIPITTLADEPERVGTDRLLCALGARELAGAPCIVVGAGTAITVDLVDAQGRFAGGAIAPGFSLSAQALHQGTASLPLVEPLAPERAVGADTTEAMRSGIDAFCRGGAAELVRRILAELPGREAEGLSLVVTGGQAERLLPLAGCELPARHVPDLIFVGMAAALAGG